MKGGTMTKRDWKLGDKVRVKQPVTAYYSNYGGKPELILTPELIGTIGAVHVPYVRASQDRTRGDYFVCVDYLDPNSEQVERAGVRYDNLQPVKLITLQEQKTMIDMTIDEYNELMSERQTKPKPIFHTGDRVQVKDLSHLKPLLRNATGTVTQWHHDDLYSVLMDSNVYTGESNQVEAVLEASEMVKADG